MHRRCPRTERWLWIEDGNHSRLRRIVSDLETASRLDRSGQRDGESGGGCFGVAEPAEGGAGPEDRLLDEAQQWAIKLFDLTLQVFEGCLVPQRPSVFEDGLVTLESLQNPI